MRESIIVRVSFGTYRHAFHKRSEPYVMRVRCRRKKFTFAISSPDDFLVRVRTNPRPPGIPGKVLNFRREFSGIS